MTKFRVDDVVEWAGEPAQVGRIVEVLDERLVRVAWDDGAVAIHGLDLLTLLRRPVRIGDVLIDECGGLHEVTWLTLENLARYPNWLGGCTHRDGTPIDSAFSGSDGKCERCGIVGPLERDRCPRCLPSKPANAPPRPSLPADRFAKAVGHLSVESLAQALWLEDGEVERHIEEHYDNHINGVCDPARTKAAQQRAWDRDDLGKRTKWTDVAKAVLLRLGGAR